LLAEVKEHLVSKKKPGEVTRKRKSKKKRTNTKMSLDTKTPENRRGAERALRRVENQSALWRRDLKRRY